MFFGKLLSGANKDQRDIFKLNFWALVGLLVLFFALPRVAQLLGVIKIVKSGAFTGGCYGSSCESLFSWQQFIFIAFFIYLWIFCFWVFKKILLVSNQVLDSSFFIALGLSFLYFVVIVFSSLFEPEFRMIPEFAKTMFCNGRSPFRYCHDLLFVFFYVALLALPALYYICVYLRYRFTKKQDSNL